VQPLPWATIPLRPWTQFHFPLVRSRSLLSLLLDVKMSLMSTLPVIAGYVSSSSRGLL
jgi:hypothetical protein